MIKLSLFLSVLFTATSFAKIIETEKGKFLVTKTKVVEGALVEDLDASGKEQTYFTYGRSGVKKYSAPEFTRLEASPTLYNPKVKVLVEDAVVHGYFLKLVLTVTDSELPGLKLNDKYFEFYAYEEQDKDLAEKKLAEFAKVAKKLIGSEITGSAKLRETFRYVEFYKPYAEPGDYDTLVHEVGNNLLVHWELKFSFPELPGDEFRNTGLPTFGQWQKLSKSATWTEKK